MSDDGRLDIFQEELKLEEQNTGKKLEGEKGPEMVGEEKRAPVTCLCLLTCGFT